VIEEIKKDLVNLEALQFYKKYLLGQDVWYFKQKHPSKYLTVYDDFKHNVSDNLGIHFNNISIIGTAKMRYSLNPKKNFKEFNDDPLLPYKERSDIDLVLVSPNLFNNFWNAFRDLFNQNKLYGYNYESTTKDIFRRFVSLKKPDANHPTFKEWIERKESFNKDYQVLFDITCDINYRIYDSWESVESYHFKGINELRERLNSHGTTS
jgi:hypothetical protein